jgi:hypothetical protein
VLWRKKTRIFGISGIIRREQVKAYEVALMEELL